MNLDKCFLCVIDNGFHLVKPFELGTRITSRSHAVSDLDNLDQVLALGSWIRKTCQLGVLRRVPHEAMQYIKRLDRC
jgi:hypothetical protein